MERQTTLEVRNLNVYFKTAGGNRTQAVRNLSFQVGSGELLGIVGESGCGKSVSSLAIMGLLEFPAIAEADKICLMGTDISKNSREEAPGQRAFHDFSRAHDVVEPPVHHRRAAQ